MLSTMLHVCINTQDTCHITLTTAGKGIAKVLDLGASGPSTDVNVDLETNTPKCSTKHAGWYTLNAVCMGFPRM